MSVTTTLRAPMWRTIAAAMHADRSGAGDQHVLADDVEPQRGVRGVAERIEHGGDVVVDVRRHDEHVLGRDVTMTRRTHRAG